MGKRSSHRSCCGLRDSIGVQYRDPLARRQSAGPLAIMHAIKIIALTAVLSWRSGLAEQADTNATTGSTSPPETATRLWISCFQPRTVTTGHRQGLGRLCTPAIPLPIALKWQTNYSFFSQLLISAAEKAHLDSRSLKTILADTWDKEDKFGVWAMLPVEATSTRFKDEPVWVLEFRWEYKDAVGDGYIIQFSRQTISRETLKLITMEQCD